MFTEQHFRFFSVETEFHLDLVKLTFPHSTTDKQSFSNDIIIRVCVYSCLPHALPRSFWPGSDFEGYEDRCCLGKSKHKKTVLFTHMRNP